MTEAQVHPASSASAPEGFLPSQDNPNANEHPTGRMLYLQHPKGCNFQHILFVIIVIGEGGLRRTASVSDQRSLLDKRPDPVREVWPEMLVKIADLGNACWVVSLKVLFF